VCYQCRVRDGRAEARAEVVAFTAAGEVSGIWPIDRHPVDLVLRDGRLVVRAPGEVLPKDAPIARLGWHASPAGVPELVVDGANLVLGARRVTTLRPETLADGDTLAVDHRDVGEPAGSVVGGLLVVLARPYARPLRCLSETSVDAVEVSRPGAGRIPLQAGVAALLLGVLPFAGAFAYPPGSPTRGSLFLAAICFALAGAVGISLSRVLAHAGARLEWSRGGLRRTTAAPTPRTESWSPDDVDGVRVRLERSPDGGWKLDVALRTRRGDVPLERGRHLALRPGFALPALGALEARRLDWIDVGTRLAAALRRPPEAFVTAHADRDWPPEKARAAAATGRISLS
jgi:hypothetical protein